MQKSVGLFNVGVILATFLTLSGCHPVATDPSSFGNNAAIVGYGDGFQTDVRLSDIAGGDFTLSAWTYPLATNSMDMEIFGQATPGGFSVGYADHGAIAETATCENTVEVAQSTAIYSAKLYVQIGQSRRALYCVPITSYRWHMISIISRSVIPMATTGVPAPTRALELWVDGHKMVATGGANDVRFTEASATSTNPLMSSDFIRLGLSSDPTQLPGRRIGQYYGLLDDVSVFNRNLSSSELISQINTFGGRLRGTEAGLIAGYRFDTADETFPVNALPVPLRRTVSHLTSGRTIQKLLVSALRHNDFDRPLMDSELAKITRNASLTLPFPQNEPWYVIQGIDTADGSHKGYAGYCWDFMWAGNSTPGNPGTLNQADSYNRTVYAAYPGTVAYIDECNPLHNTAPANLVSERLLADLFLTYMHNAPNTTYPNFTGSSHCNQGGLNFPVATGHPIANVGDTGLGNPGAYHLHFAATNLPDTQANNSQLVTYPTAFSNYKVFNTDSLTWDTVVVGIPRAGQWIKR